MFQVVQINGKDISSLTHDQVVGCIRAAARENKLVLAVKQVGKLDWWIEDRQVAAVYKPRHFP